MKMFNFSHPAVLLFAPLLLPAGWLSWRALKKKQERIETFASRLALAKMELDGEKRKRERILSFLALFFLIVALAGPRIGFPNDRQDHEKISILFDASLSMLAGDAEGRSRLERAQDDLDVSLDSLDGFKVALTAFAKETRSLVPLTGDLRAVQTMGKRLKVGELAAGSDLEKALRFGAERLEEGGGKIFLFSDGEELSGHAENALPELRDKKIKVFVCGYGSTGGVTLPGEPDLWGNPTAHRFRGETVVSRLNRSLLEKIARETGGDYFENPAPDVLPKVLAKSDPRQKNGSVRLLYPFPAFLAFLSLLLSSLEKNRLPKFLRFDWPLFLVLVLFLGGWTPIDLARNAAALRAARENRWNEATKQLEEASKASQDPRLLYNYGCALYQQGNFEKAEKVFRATLKRNPKDSRTSYNLGNTLYRLGEKKEPEAFWTKAIAQYKQALSLDPRDEDARYNLAFLERKLKEAPKKQSPAQTKKKNEANRQEPSQAEIDEALGMLEQDERQRQAQTPLQPSPDPAKTDALNLKDLWSPSEPDW